MTILRRFLAVLLITLSAAAQAEKDVDTSAWICEFCPFQEGTVSDNEFGVTNVSDDSAYLGNGTGLDEEGLYANIDARGSAMGDGQYLRWNVEDLGLDSRLINIDGGKAGRYDYYLDWNELPYRRFFSTSTVFSSVADGDLVLPADWVRAGTTGGFTALDANLVNRPIQSDRQNLGIGGSYQVSGSILARVDVRQRNNEGVRMVGGSTYNNASLLPAVFDHTTDELELGLRYGNDNAFLGVSWFLSDFDNKFESLGWEQPFLTADGAGSPELARAPDNRFQQLRLSGGYALTEWRTVFNLTAAIGQIEQDASFLPYTSNPNLAPEPLPRSGLNGEVETTNVVLSMNARPLAKVRVRASYRYDERQNNTPVATYSRVIADAFLSGEEQMNAPFSYERRKFSGALDWDAMSKLRLSTGFEYKEYERTLQEVTDQDEFLSYGRARLRPTSSVELDARYGNSRREIDNYDEELALALGQNPLLRKYNLAYRFREYVDLRANWSPAELPVSLAFTALLADDSYTQSQLGLTNGEEQSYAVDFSWFFSENASLFLNAGVDNLEAEQLGSEFFGAPDWQAANDDTFTSWGGGFNVDNLGGKVDLRFSAITSRGESRIAIRSAAAGRDQFPDLETELDRLRLDLIYRFSPQMDFTCAATYQRFETSDWALQGVRPDAVPQLFSLGVEPFDDDNVILTVGVRYRLGTQ